MDVNVQQTLFTIGYMQRQQNATAQDTPEVSDNLPDALAASHKLKLRASQALFRLYIFQWRIDVHRLSGKTRLWPLTIERA
ncbi:hypothetical protein G4Y79_22595 [Phototrophicus methaneseepsis]|uniref:Uncharacterized protein n=1 Tax=Phototrophicus methaneseepsis TaxID=2710758 RepID=A0A7S8IEB9_9CHLR|nr:hypothetical protein [Phototrophicus methaneseepsis]QPC82441.1 hypothetical protein G4Y79_22595 [Phototrophicus methaneseepsis]